MSSHPNATVSLGAGSGLGALIVWALTLWTTVPPPAAAAIAGAVSALALLVGRNGVQGAVRIIWKGKV